jgi:transposase
VLDVRAVDPQAQCPGCGHLAVRVHSHYQRTMADLSCQGLPVRLHMHVRRFWCEQAACPRAIFTERLPALAAPYARRTQRLSDVLLRVGVVLGGEAGARMLPVLGMTSSADTLLRLVHRAAIAPAPPPRVVGVDDWAIRRGHAYGTILVDLERRSPIDLLADRTADTLSRWLAEHPGIAIVARDRAETYAQGIREGSPEATQVADRWHLLKNLGEVLERVLQHHRAALERAATLASDAAPAAEPAYVTAADVEDSAATQEAVEKAATPTPTAVADQPPRPSPTRTKRQQLYERVHALHAQVFSIHAISQQTGVARPTVRKYLRADQCPERAQRRTSIGAWTDYSTFLRKRWDEGCRDAVMLWRELVARGFRGTLRTVQRHVSSWRRVDSPRNRTRGGEAGAAASPTMRPPSPRQLRWWLLQPAAEPNPERGRFIQHLLEQCPAVAIGQRLAQEFVRLVRGRDAAALVPWLEQAESSSLAEFRDFAAGLRRDDGAVKAALTQPWSNGQTEGQVTKLKMLKRQMYGRASVALLRQRMLLAA